MQIASKQCVWNVGETGTVIEVVMTSATGLRIQFHFGGFSGKETTVDWGDGSESSFTSSERIVLSHTYAEYGAYTIRCKNLKFAGLRYLDGQSQYSYDAAIVSFVDYDGTVTGSSSGAFKKCVNLKRVILPNCTWMGQRDFAYCTALEEVVLGNCTIFYDGTFQGCTALSKYTAGRTGVCWSYVWKDCVKLTELNLGKVSQFATQDFTNTPLLKDIWISDKTVDQIRQVAASGNIVAGYNAKFPWGACSDCRFHGTDGIVLGNGTVIRN